MSLQTIEREGDTAVDIFVVSLPRGSHIEHLRCGMHLPQHLVEAQRVEHVVQRLSPNTLNGHEVSHIKIMIKISAPV
jgi:hypothetical protein